MLYQYFQPTPTTAEDAKKMYRTLAHQHHPDKGGDLETMKTINAEYAKLLTDLEKANQYTRQKEAHAENRKTTADYHDMEQVAEVLREKIEAALNIDGLTVELCGLWVWLTGETKANKETIKAIGGFRWAREKEAWYFAGVPSFNRQKRTMEEIREMHGSTTFCRRQRKEEEASAALHA